MLRNLHKNTTNNEKSSNKSQRSIFNRNHPVFYYNHYNNQTLYYGFFHSHRGCHAIYQTSGLRVLFFWKPHSFSDFLIWFILVSIFYSAIKWEPYQKSITYLFSTIFGWLTCFPFSKEIVYFSRISESSYYSFRVKTNNYRRNIFYIF